MNFSDTNIQLLNEVENLKRLFYQNKFNLLKINFSEIVLSIFRFPLDFIFSEIFLEFIIKISEAIYWKSKILLNFDNELEENEEISFREKNFFYYSKIPLNNILGEKTFLPKLSKDILKNLNLDSILEKGDINLLLKAMIRVLEKEAPEIKILNVPEISIEDYIKDAKEELNKRKSITFNEFIFEKKNKGEIKKILEIIYYFLAFLFLCFQNYCSMVQTEEFGDIIIFVKNI